MDASRIVDNSRFNRFHLMVLTLCGFMMIFDGYDIVIYGSVVPVLIQEWSISPVQAGAIGSYGLFGMMVGALSFSILADKIGRKPTLIVCLSLFSFFTGLAAFAAGPTDFGIYRFLAGLGLGGVMPLAISLTSEYAPKRVRSLLVSAMFSGYMVGGVAAAGTSALLIPSFGWRPVFIIGAVPLLLVPVLIKYLPESLGFLASKGKTDQARTTLRRIELDPALTESAQFNVPENPPKVPITELFRRGYAFSTIMFWISFFMCLLMIYGLLTWLPQLMIQAGYPLGSSLTFLLILNLAAIVGTIFGGYLADRVGSKRVLVTYYLLAAIFVFMLGFKTNAALLYLLVAIAGASTFGAQVIANAYAAQFYPSSIRATGVGWSLGIGRIGAIVGPLMGGILIAAEVPLKVNFLAFAIPGLIALTAITLINERISALAPMETAVADAGREATEPPI